MQFLCKPILGQDKVKLHSGRWDTNQGGGLAALMRQNLLQGLKPEKESLIKCISF